MSSIFWHTTYTEPLQLTKQSWVSVSDPLECVISLQLTHASNMIHSSAPVTRRSLALVQIRRAVNVVPMNSDARDMRSRSIMLSSNFECIFESLIH